LKRKKYIFALICIDLNCHNSKFGFFECENEIIVQNAGKSAEKSKKKLEIGLFI